MPYWRLSGVYFTYFAVVGALAPYWGLYLEHLQFDARAIGILSAIPMITRLFAPNIWGWMSDRTNKPLLIIRLGALGGFLGFVGVLGRSDILVLAFFIAIYSFFWNAILAQFEVVTLRYLGDQPFLYSRIRLWGSIGFIVAVAALGVLFDWVSISWLAVIILVLLGSIFLFTCSLPPLRTHSTHTNKEGFLTTLKQKQVMLFFFVLFLLQFSHGAYYTFYSIYLQDYGYSTSLIGLVWSIGVVAEIVLFIYMPQILHRVSLFWLLSVSMFLTAFRWWLIGWFPESEWVIFSAQILHAASFGVTHSVAIEFVRRYFSASAQSQGQAFYSAIGFGAGGALGAYISGEIWLFSPQWAFGVACISSLVGGLLTVIFLKAFLSQK